MMNASNDIALDHAGTLENLDVLRDRRGRHRETGRDLAHRQTSACEPFDDTPSCRVPEGCKYPIEASRIFNHSVI